MRRSLLALFLLFIFTTTSRAADYAFDYNTRCHNAYLKYLSLDLDGGTNLIRQELMANPYNLMATYLADYDDCLLLMMNGDKRDYDQRNSHLDERLDLISNGSDRSPWYRLCKAGLYFHWALVHIRFGENLKAAATFRKSFLLLKENNKLFPNFPQNKVFLGMEEAVVGTIPGDYQWLASIFGMKGNVKRGVAQLTHFINSTDANTPLRAEAVIYNCYIKFYLMSQQEEIWSYLNSSQFQTQNNLFHSFIKANIALNFRKGDQAIQVLRTAQNIDDYKKYPILDYELGSALLHKLDNGSITYLNRFLSRYTGRFFVKDAYQKLALLYYIDQDKAKANYYREQIKRQGSKQVDADKQAQRFAEESDWPTIPLLQARMLTDGGYYQQALQKLQGTQVNTLSASEKLEYYFRMARIYDELNNDGKAIQFYQTTVSMGRDRREHFAARSALQLGMLYERSGKPDEAVKCYNDCLSMKNHDFQANIDQQAKAGVNRLTQR